MSDLISRKWLMECVDEGWIKFDTEKDKNIYVHLVRDIAPSAQPEQRWIPFKTRPLTKEEKKSIPNGTAFSIANCQMTDSGY